MLIITYNIYVAMKNYKLLKIRKKLDKLDDKFLALIKKEQILLMKYLKLKNIKRNCR